MEAKMKSEFFTSASMATRLSDLITMRHFLAIPPVATVGQETIYPRAATCVSWFEYHGGKDVLKWERWKPLQQDMWLVMSPRK